MVNRKDRAFSTDISLVIRLWLEKTETDQVAWRGIIRLIPAGKEMHFQGEGDFVKKLTGVLHDLRKELPIERSQ